MLTVLLYICSAVIALSLLLQLVWVLQFIRLYRQPARAAPPAPDALKVAVILCVRGADPSLERCVHGILTQKYPRYDVKIMVDHADDPARAVVERVIRELHAEHAAVQVIPRRRTTCALKLSALIEAIEPLDDGYFAVALIDADVLAYPEWLGDLVAPLTEPGVGASHGLRWFVPCATNFGTLIRYIWNAGATTQMVAFGIPWGGALAIRMDAIRRCDVLGEWSRYFFDDTCLTRLLARNHLQVRTVPRVTMTSRETAAFADAFRFIRRQMLAARLYHPGWRWTFAFGLLANLALAASVALVLLGSHTRFAVLLGVSGPVVYFVGLALGLLIVERYIQLLQVARGQPRWRVPWQALALIPAAHAIYLAATLSAYWLRRVQWRGVTYEVRGPRDIRLVEYQPFATTASADASLI